MLRCQQTLQPLELTAEGLYSRAADLLYPVRDDLVFMGYPAESNAFMQTVMEEERVHQTSPDLIGDNYAFLDLSSAVVGELIDLLRTRDALRDGMVGVEIGAGSGWVSWLFAEAGCEMWPCELEPNSLATGLVFRHPKIGERHRIVCDAALLPFDDGAFDLVLCKEFAHHIVDKRALFMEANRVLRPGGLLVMLEPVQCLSAWIETLRHPDPHTGHAVGWIRDYLEALRAAGFTTTERGSYHYREGGRFRVTRRLRERSREAIRRRELTLDPLTRGFMNLFGGTLWVLARKTASAARVPRPPLKLVSPSQLRVTKAELALYEPFAELLRERSPARAVMAEDEFDEALRTRAGVAAREHGRDRS